MLKNYNKVLEAIQNGINIALDDFEDEDIQSYKEQTIKDKNLTKEYIDLMNDVVDLGLPSGTLWCKYNLGVNPKQLIKPEDWYGGYYTWGELKGNKTNEKGEIYFSWNNYKYGKSYNKLIKYCTDAKYGLNGFTDNLTELLPEDDAAYQNKKIVYSGFHMPTKKQLEELLTLPNEWVRNYNGIKYLNGKIFTGTNGNQLFIPAAGFYSGSYSHFIGDECNLWSSSLNLDEPSHAWYSCFYSYKAKIGYSERCNGFSARPVINL